MGDANQAREEIWARVPKEKRFSMADIRRATNNFSQVLGEGDSATVYLGHIHGHRRAIKVRKPHSRQGEKAFMAEIAVLSRYGHHPALVRFVGCFRDGGNPSTIAGIVYEYMPDGSLEDHLDGHQIPLSWGRLLHILIGVGNGLVYLHSHGVIHRDIRPPNILLDSHLTGKISDFGICKVPHQHGYLATPVYPQLRPSTTEEDVFEFGLVLLEVLHWKRAMNQRRELQDWANRLIRQGGHSQREMEELHRRWMAWELISVNSRRHVQQTAFLCLQQNPRSRPAMAAVVNELQRALQLQPHGR